MIDQGVVDCLKVVFSDADLMDVDFYTGTAW